MKGIKYFLLLLITSCCLYAQSAAVDNSEILLNFNNDLEKIEENPQSELTLTEKSDTNGQIVNSEDFANTENKLFTENDESNLEITGNFQDNNLNNVEEVNEKTDLAESLEQIENNVTEELKENLIEESEKIAESEAKEETSVDEEILKYLTYISENESLLYKKNESADLIQAIEDVKTEILLLRSNCQNEIAQSNAASDEELEIKKQEILNAALKNSEKNANGEISELALQRRNNKCIEIEKSIMQKKAANEEIIRRRYNSDEKKYNAILASLYKELESSNFVVTSYSSECSLSVGDFDFENGVWPLSIKCSMFGVDSIFKYSLEVPYSVVTGKKYVKIEKLSDDDFEAFQETINLYSSLFEQLPQVLYTKLTFEVYRWKLASEYRMKPKTLEVLYMPKKNKQIAKIDSDLSPRVFSITPAKEIRTTAEISNDSINAAKIIAKEAKEKESEDDKFYEEYANSYEKSKKSSMKAPVIQKGRGSVYVSAAESISVGKIQDIVNDFDPEKIIPEEINLELTFPVGKFAFWGLEGGVSLPEYNKIKLGLDFGFNFKITNGIRPYVKASAAVHREYFGFLNVGGGLDFIFAKCILLNLGYNYSWKYDLYNVLNPDDSLPPGDGGDIVPCTMQHNVSVGIGFAW